MNDKEYEFAEELTDMLMEILDHNWKFGVEEQFPDLQKLDEKSFELVKKVRKYHCDYL